MKPVQDPNLIMQLEGGLKPVRDPATIGALESPGSQGLADRAQQFTHGFNTGLSNMVGMPVDVAGWLMRKAGVEIDAPIGGSDWLKQLMTDASMRGGEGYEQTFDRTGRMVSRVGEEMGATAPMMGGMLAAAKAGVKGPGLVREMMDATRAAPGVTAAAETGLAVASGTGAGVAGEMYPGNATAEVIGQMAPTLGPAAVAGAVRGAVRGGEAGRQVLQSNLDTFARAGVDPNLGQATGGTSTQALHNAMAKAPGGVAPMRKAAQQAAEQLKGSVYRVADDIAPKATAEQAGRTISRGIEGFTKRFQNTADTLFSRLDQFIDVDDLVDASHTANAFRDLTKPIAGAENVSAALSNKKIAQLAEAFQSDAATGRLPYRALKELRSMVGRSLSESELVSEAPRAQMKRLYKALSQDLETAASVSGPDAMRAYERANSFYRAGLQRIDDSLESLAKKGAEPEKLFLAMTRGGKEGATTLRKVRHSLTPDEWDTVSATLLRRMGRAKPSQQDDLGEVFSVETYLTNWNSLSDDAKKAIFGGERYRRIADDLDAIAKTASSIREASRTLANPSGTAGQFANQGAGMLAGGALLAGDLTIPLSIAGVAATNNAASRVLMTNPRFIQWLAQSTRIPAERLPGHFGRLSDFLRDEDAETQEAALDYLELFGQ